MKTVIKFMLTATLFCGIATIGTKVSDAVEMETDVGIEFTEIEPEPSSSSEPPAVSKPPITKKPMVILPQTGETSHKSSLFVGGSLLVGASLLLWRKREEGDAE